MIKAKRDGQDMHFDNMEELMVFIVERMTFKSELDEVKSTMATKEDLKAFATKEDLKAFATKEDLASVEHRLRDHIDTGLADVKRTTASLLREKGIISKSEGLEYIRGTV